MKHFFTKRYGLEVFVAFVLALLTLAPSLAAAAGEEERVKQGLAALLPDVEIQSVDASPIPGLYEVMVGPRIFYVSADGRYLLQGRVIDMQTRADLTEPKLEAAKKRALSQVGEENMIIFSPENPKHTITVFTDIDCGYCRKLHRDMDALLHEGIRVRYLFYPRAGIGSTSYQKAVSVWCADDRNKALTAAKSGQQPAAKTCDNPVREHMQLGELMGVSGTPTIVLEDGQVVPGYLPPKRMAALLEGHGKGR